MNRLEFFVLSVLQKAEAVDRLSSMTVREITEMEEGFGLRENTVSKKIRNFEQSGYIARGMKEGHANTFYITQKGCEFLEGEKRP